MLPLLSAQVGTIAPLPVSQAATLTMIALPATVGASNVTVTSALSDASSFPVFVCTMVATPGSAPTPTS